MTDENKPNNKPKNKKKGGKKPTGGFMKAPVINDKDVVVKSSE